MGLFGRDDRTTPQPATPQPPASRPAAKPQPRPSESTLVARGSRVEGRLFADNDVEVTGEVHGTVEAKAQVLISEGARVEAALHGRVVVVAGRVAGDVSADEKIELLPSAELRGNITAPRIVIQDGATFEGQVFMQKPEGRKPAVPAAAEPAPPTPEPSNPAGEAPQPPGGGDPARHHRNRR